jgi:hypothetical protein
MINVNNEEIINTWYKKATVRHTPRILIPNSMGEELVYPVARCHVCDHPLVIARGREVLSYLLNQAAYLFYGVGLLETKFVINCCLDIIHDHITGMSDFDKLQAYSVIVDEGFHAHVALDYIIQMQQQSNIMPLLVPQTNRKIEAAQRASEKLPEHMRMDFKLLVVTIAENVLTEDIANIGRERGVTETFCRVMTEHVSDEGRHSKYFIKLMQSHWPKLSHDMQQQFKQMVPEFLDDFLSVDLTRNFEQQILAQCGFTSDKINKIIADTQQQFVADHQATSSKSKSRLYSLLKLIDASLSYKESLYV